MNTESFFYPSMIKLIIRLKDKDNSNSSCMKECNMLWSQVNKSFQLLYMYNFVDIEKTKGSRYYNLTEDGKKLRDSFCIAYSLIKNNRKMLETQIYGYNNKKEMIEDVSKDLMVENKIIDSTTTTLT